MEMLWVLGILLAALSWAQAPDEKKWEEVFEKAKRTYGEPKYKLGLESWELAKKFPEGDVRRMRALALLAGDCMEGVPYCQQGEGLKYYQQGLEEKRKVVIRNGAFAEGLTELSVAANNREQRKQAIELQREAIAVWEEVKGRNSIEVSRAFLNLASDYSADGQKEERKKALAEAVARQKTGSENYARLHVEMASYHQDDDERAQLEAAKEAARVFRDLHGPRSRLRFERLQEVAMVAPDPLSRELYRELANLALDLYGPKSRQRFSALQKLGTSLNLSDDAAKAEAVEVLNEALEVAKAAKLELYEQAAALSELGDIHKSRKSFAEAAEFLEQAAMAYAKDPEDSSYLSAACWADAAIAHAELGQHEDVTRCLRTIQTESKLGKAYSLAATQDQIGQIYLRRRDPARAIPHLEAAVAQSELSGTESGREVQIARLRRLAEAYTATGRMKEADAVNSRLLRVSIDSINGNEDVRKQFIWGLGVFFGFFAVIAGVLAAIYARLQWKMDQRILGLYSGAERRTRFQYFGEAADLFAIRIYNLFLSILTLGVYSFWGKAKLRRYICSQAELLGDRFTFHGTGRELFLGWLKGAPILLFIFFFPNVLPLLWESVASLPLAQFAAMLVLLLVWPLARMGAFRYRMNRMSWRGIRFGFIGTTRDYFGLSMLGYVLCAISLGLYAPVLNLRQRQYLFSGSYFGNMSVGCEGRGRELLWRWIFVMPLIPLTLGLIWPFWSALRSRYYWAHTTLDGARFRCTVTGRGLLWLWITNILGVIATLGLGYSWATMRTLRYWADNLTLEGQLTPELITQREDKAFTFGESFADYLGFDFGF